MVPTSPGSSRWLGRDRLGGLVAALPVVTILVLVWLWLEGVADSKIANHA